MIDLNVATLEVDKWLDNKRVRAKKREEQRDSIDTLIDAIAEGELVLDDDFNLIHNLRFPVGNEGHEIKQLTYVSRIKVSDIRKSLKGVKGGDSHGHMLAYVSALTAKPVAILSQLDTEDYPIAQAIMIFFV